MSTIIEKSFYVDGLNRKVHVRVYLPKSYKESDSFYPVLYMQDGQNIFDEENASYGMSWNIHRFFDHYESEEYIVVGVDSAPGLVRLDEYSPWINTKIKESFARFSEEKRDVGGLGKVYADFFVKDLRNYINENYRTLKEANKTWVVGSSMGAIISLYLGGLYPHIYGRIGAFSTAIWFAKEELMEFVSIYTPSNMQKIYLDIGTRETSDESIEDFENIYLKDTLDLEKQLKNQGFKDNNLMTVIDDGAVHNELAWAKRFPKAFEFLRA